MSNYLTALLRDLAAVDPPGAAQRVTPETPETHGRTGSTPPTDLERSPDKPGKPRPDRPEAGFSGFQGDSRALSEPPQARSNVDAAVPAGPRVGEPAEALPEAAPWPPRAPELARWPVMWRERWGLRANELQGQGLGWREAEMRAFDEVRSERERGAAAPGREAR